MATRLGSFASFAAVWVAMMAATMLPGAAPAVARTARVGGMRAVPLFAGSYLAVWALAGAVVFAACRPYGTAADGAVMIAAGLMSSRRSNGTSAAAAARPPGRVSGSGCAA